MNFDLTPEQTQLQDSATRFVREQMDFAKWQKVVASGAPFDPSNWAQMADLGWLALNIPEEDGGLGGTPFDTMVIMEALGGGLALEPYVSSCVLAPHLLCGLGESVRQPLFEALASGQVQITTALAEESGGFNIWHVTTQARKTADGYVLQGGKSYVPDAKTADYIIIPARLSGPAEDRTGLGLFLVEAKSKGLTQEHFRAPDYRRLSRLKLDDVTVAAGFCIATGTEAADLLEKALDHAMTAEMAEAVGAMDAAASQTLQYLKTREQFGVTIGTFQVLQHRMADMTIACEEARSLLYYATDSLNADPATRRKAIAAAKARIGQCGLYVGQQAVQLHGGMGASDELPISHYLKRLRMLDMRFGNADHHLASYAQLKMSA